MRVVNISDPIPQRSLINLTVRLNPFGYMHSLRIKGLALNCSINEIMSKKFQSSMIFSSRKENTVIPFTLNCLLVG
jgi:hypothetical protein